MPPRWKLSVWTVISKNVRIYLLFHHHLKMQATQDVRIRNVFKLCLPIIMPACQMKDIEFKWSNLPLLSVTLIDRTTMKHVDSYILRLFLLYEQEEEVPCGLSWAKRNPLSFYTDPQNPQQVAGVTLRVRVPEKMFDFRKASGANGSKPQGKVIVSSSSHHYTATTEWFNLLPKRRAHQDAGHNDGKYIRYTVVK
jgi:hypothetical protein